MKRFLSIVLTAVIMLSLMPLSIFGISADTANMGDINADGKVDTYDYLLIKRDYFGTYETEGIIADVN